MIVFYFYNSLLLYNVCLETLHINNEKYFILSNIWSKEAIVNVSYTSTDNHIDGYMDSRISDWFQTQMRKFT